MSDSTIKVAIVGAGNMAWSLIPSLQQAGTEVVQLISRNEERRQTFAQTYGIPQVGETPRDLIADLDLIFLTVPDGVLSGLAAGIALDDRPGTILLHTSGSSPLSLLAGSGDAIGVFYPMQIFTQSRVTPFAHLPIFLEGNASVMRKIDPLAKAMSDRVYFLNSYDRLRLHMGAVMACNFSNLLFRLTSQVLPPHPDLDFSVYEPLVREHIDKVFAFGPKNTQTGPAIRGDMDTISQHMQLLSDHPNIQKLYGELSQMINPDLNLDGHI
ncbi:F420-dependent NADP oxidoreductase [Pontibacter sp. G13]|uniref:Rossmann-like and DUF2520 domain-containing protein n=1 Tax=Pontibacter sp. G13 TaxID=3074898 RepID=UPI0028896918|nr:F420-dependent NADP oxidoreductase [Pontibacter sp. G13]WNJ20845.1 F420-dependent NADP oxidoreductase [Pontibacter sp. G13]